MFKVPKVVTYSLLGEWIRLIDLSRYDCALCNSSMRDYLLQTLENEFFVAQNKDGTAVNCNGVNWLKLRNIRVSSICVKSLPISEDTHMLQNLNLNKLRKVVLECDKWNGGDKTWDFLTHCGELTDMSVRGGNPMTAARIALHISRNVPRKLETLRIDYHKGLSISTIGHVFTQCTALTHFTTMYFDYNASDSEYISMAFRGKYARNNLIDDVIGELKMVNVKLHSIDFHECQLLSNATLTRVLKAYGNMLKELNIGHCRLLTDAIVPEMVKYCPTLQNVELTHCDLLSEAAIKIVNDLCVESSDIVLPPKF